MENKHTQQVDFSNPNADKITSGTTNKPMVNRKTAIQELIDEIVEHLTYDDDLSDDSRTTYETIRLRCLSKLAMEKEQIIDSFGVGCQVESTRLIGYQGIAEQYYNETYNK